MNSMQQRGTTMISLLVGMIVSMLAILASVSMFHDLVQTSAEAKTDARQEGDLSLAVLRLDQELLAAGFNMGRAPTDARNLDFAVDAAVVPQTSRVSWRFNDGTRFICRRVVSVLNGSEYTLDLFEANAGLCLPAGPMPAIADDSFWTQIERLAFIRLQSFDANLPVTLLSPLITFSSTPTEDTACMPFGATAPLSPGAVAPKHPVLTLNVFDVASVYAVSGVALTPRPHTLCLVNVVL
ncbi:MAG TPA: hypothetical protein VIZ65_11635 [Cellvibrionaceae bacterium]